MVTYYGFMRFTNMEKITKNQISEILLNANFQEKKVISYPVELCGSTYQYIHTFFQNDNFVVATEEIQYSEEDMPINKISYFARVLNSKELIGITWGGYVSCRSDLVIGLDAQMLPFITPEYFKSTIELVSQKTLYTTFEDSFYYLHSDGMVSVKNILQGL